MNRITQMVINRKYIPFLLVGALSTPLFSFSQETPASDTASAEIIPDEPFDNSLLSGEFNGSRIINGHSTKTTSKGSLEYRIEHRFGDVAGGGNGVYTWFGLDNSTDIRMAFEYGITDKLMVGLGRSKGASAAFSSLIDYLVKYRIVDQEKGKSPVSLAVVGSAFYTYQKSSANIYDIDHFAKQAHRLSYTTVAIISSKLSRRVSAAIIPSYIHRNYVAADDINDLFAVGGAVKLGVTKQMGFIVEYYQTFHDKTVRTTNTNSLGVAVEFVTFGHTFTINLTNSTGLGEPQFIAATTSDWLKGQFRLGFTIGRKFSW